MLKLTSMLASLALVAPLCFSSVQAQQLPSLSEPGPQEDSSFGLGGTFLSYEFEPRYGASNVDTSIGLAGGSATLVSIGSETGGLSYVRDFSDPTGRYDNYLSSIDERDGEMIVVALGSTHSFNINGSSYEPLYGSQATLTKSGNTWTLIDGSGTEYDFVEGVHNGADLSATAPVYAPNGRITEARLPDGVRLNFDYTSVTLCSNITLAGSSACEAEKVVTTRLMSVRSTLGYQIKYQYEASQSTWDYADGSHTNIVKVTALNNTVDVCNPLANSCSGLTKTWPSVSFTTTDNAGFTTLNVTNALNQTTRYKYNASNQLTHVRFPSSGSGADDIVYAYIGGRVSSVHRYGSMWIYAYADSGDIRTTSVTAPGGAVSVSKTKISTQQMTSSKTPMGHETVYEYDAQDRLWKITAPEGNFTQYTYKSATDNRVTNIAQNPKPGSAQTVMNTSIHYLDCTTANRKWCNKPRHIDDWRGRTVFTYSNLHGGLTILRQPDGGDGVLTTNTQYSPLTARYKNTSGAIISSPASIYRPTTTTTGTRKTTMGWQSGDPRNLTLSWVDSGSTDGTILGRTSVAYDDFGNTTVVNGPLSGNVDRVRLHYNILRQNIMVVSNDPDGGGVQKYRAQLFNFNADGQLWRTRTGTATGFENVSSFVALEDAETSFDSHGRPVQRRFKSSGITHAEVDYTYDNRGRVSCVIQKMYGLGGAANACSAGSGPFGPHRITKRNYNNDNEVTSFVSAYGTNDAITESLTYHANGMVHTVSDAKGNVTTYSYDGHDRRTITDYPGSGGNDVYTYFPNKPLVHTHERRDGIILDYSYDAIGRMTGRDAPGTSEDITNVDYDIYNQMLSITGGGRTLSNTYDKIGRLDTTTMAGVGAVGYDYDIAGRRTRMDYPGSGLFVTYAYNAGGQLHQIRENGATSGVGVLATYEYDQLGRRTKLTRGNGVVTDYGFDTASRLDELDFTLPNDTAKNQQVDFQYNPAGQITRREASNASYEPTIGFEGLDALYNHLNQMTSLTLTQADGTVNPTKTLGAGLNYDGRGNMTGDGTNSFAFDNLNRLKSVNGTTTLDYDPLGRLWQEVSGGNTLRFAYDGSDLIAELNTSGNGVVQRRYVHGPGVDEPLVWYEGSGTSDRRFMVSDERGSVVLVTRSNGTTLAQNKYDEYGKASGGNVGRFGYTGQTKITGTDIWHYKARAYSAELGRFLQPDPIGYADGLNMYAYVAGDPVNATDPTGTSSVIIVKAKGRKKPVLDFDVMGHHSRPGFQIPVHINIAPSWGGGDSSGGSSSSSSSANSSDQADPCPDTDCIVVRARRQRRFSDGTRITLGRSGEQGFVVSMAGIFPIDATKRGTQQCEDGSVREITGFDRSAFGGNSGGHTHTDDVEGLPGPEDGVLARVLGTAYIISRRGAFRIDYSGGEYSVTLLDGSPLSGREQRAVDRTVARWNRNRGGSGVKCTTKWRS